MTWRPQRVGELASLSNGHPFDATDFSPTEDMPLVRIRDIQAADFETFIPKGKVPASAVVQNDDVVIGMDGDFNVVLWRRGEAAVNQRVCFLRANGRADPRFLAYVLPSHLRKINDLTYSTTVKHLSGSQVLHIKFNAPLLDEQRAIADYLDQETARIDALVAKQEEFVALLRARRTAIVDAVVTRGLRSDVALKPSGTTWIGDIPVDWMVRPLWSMFRRVKDVGHPEEQMLSVFREYGVIAKDSRDNNNKTAENRNIYQLVYPGWLVTNRMKAWQGSVGVSQLRGIVSGHYLCFEPCHDDDSRYLNWLFRCPRYAAGYASISRGVRIGQAEIDNADYKVLPVVVPPKAEQIEIAAYLDDKTSRIDTLIFKAEEHIALAKERRAALITAAVTGQFDVRTARKAG